ncbi:MAG: hypothetical protein QM756_28945 [Polyangiaceae bacterium]
MTLGEATFRASLAGLLCAALVTLRGALGAGGFCIVAGASALVLAPLMASLVPLHAVGRGAGALVCGFMLSCWPLSVLASALKATTHHRPLGAVTFGCLALVVVVGAIAIALRSIAYESGPRWGVLARIVMVASLLSALSLLLPLLRAPDARGGLFDVSLLVGSGAALTLVRWPEALRVQGARLGPWLWAGLVIVGLVSSRGAAQALATAATPALSAPFGWF